MSSIALTSSDGGGLLSPSGIPTMTRPYDSSSDFVHNVIEIVKSCSESHDYTHVGESLRKLRASLPTDVPFKETLNALIAQVKEVTPEVDLPVVYCHLIQELELGINKDYLTLAGLSPADEVFRIACAFLAVEAFPTRFAANVQKYGIRDQEALVKLATIVAQRDGSALARSILRFGIVDEEARLAIAMLAAKCSPSGLAECVKNFGITKENGRIALAKEAIVNGNDIFTLLSNFEIRDETGLAELTLLAIEKNPSKIMRSSLKSMGIKTDKNLFMIAKVLIEKCPSDAPFNIDRFPITNEEMRFELAKLLAVRDSGQLAASFRKYQITNPEWRSAVAKLVAAQENNGCLAEYIRYFDIELESDRIELAKEVAKKNPVAISRNIRLFQITSEKARIEIAELVAMRDGGAFSKGVDNFQITDKQALFRLAKLAAHQNGAETSRHIQRFGIADSLQRVEVFLIGIEESLGTAAFIQNYAFSLEDKTVLFSRFGKGFLDELSSVFSVFVTDKGKVKPKTILESYPEYIGFGADGNLTQCVFDLWEVEGIPFSSIESLYKNCQQLAKETDPAVKERLTQLYSLEISAWRYAYGTPLLATLLDEVEKIGREKNPLVFKHLTFDMLSLLLQCHALKIDKDTVAPHRELFSLIMGIKDAEVRSNLIMSFANWVSTSPAQLPLKSKMRALAALLLSSFVPKIEKFQSLIQLKDLKDEIKIKTLLRNLVVLVNNPILSEEEKLYILNNLIFVEGPKLKVKEQAKRVLDFSEIVAQFINCAQARVLVEFKDFEALSNGSKELYERMLGIPKALCGTAIDETIKKWRRPQSLLTYASKLSTLPPSDRDKLLPLLKKFTLSVLNGTFNEERYAVDENASSHLKKLQSKNPTLLDSWKKGSVLERGDYIVVDTDHPCDLLLAGTEMGSCQRVDGDPSKSKCLIAYLLDPKIRMMAVKNKAGITVARSMLRLLWDASSDQFVLFQEHNYPSDKDANSQKLDAACLARAKELGVPLFRKMKDPQSPTEGTTLKAFSGTIPYEYVDSTDERIHAERGYEITQCECFYMPQEER